MAQELTNPLADLVSVPVQMNFDRRIGPLDDGSKVTTNVQPVIPFQGAGDWSVISQTIVPIVYQDETMPGTGAQFGLGDISLMLLLSPRESGAGGFIWDAGPVLLLRTATDSKIGGRKWGAGPAAVGLTIRGPWTFGVRANHIWSFAGDDARRDISNTFVQPFVAYTWPNAWTFSVPAIAVRAAHRLSGACCFIGIVAAALERPSQPELPALLPDVVSPDSGPRGIRFRLHELRAAQIVVHAMPLRFHPSAALPQQHPGAVGSPVPLSIYHWRSDAPCRERNGALR